MARRPAFTLVELLIVITLVAVLIAMLLPALGQAKDRAITTQCGALERQWGVVLAQYIGDNKATFPIVAWKEGGYLHTSWGWTWDDLCSDYFDPRPFTVRRENQNALMPHKMLRCPASPYVQPSGATIALMDYRINAALGVSSIGAEPAPAPWSAKEANVQAPANVIGITERPDGQNGRSRCEGTSVTMPHNQSLTIYQRYTSSAVSTINTPYPRGVGLHVDATKMNYVYLDGHVMTMFPFDTDKRGMFLNSYWQNFGTATGQWSLTAADD